MCYVKKEGERDRRVREKRREREMREREREGRRERERGKEGEREGRRWKTCCSTLYNWSRVFIITSPYLSPFRDRHSSCVGSLDVRPIISAIHSLNWE